MDKKQADEIIKLLKEISQKMDRFSVPVPYPYPDPLPYPYPYPYPYINTRYFTTERKANETQTY